MKILVIGDSHGNIANLKHVLGFGKHIKVEAVIHTGDWNTLKSLETVFNYNISIEGELIYERKIESKVPRLFIPKRRLVVGIYNQEEIYGPCLAEVMLWQ